MVIRKFQSPKDVLQFSKVTSLAPKTDHCREINDKPKLTKMLIG
jgi:hypothetical protein